MFNCKYYCCTAPLNTVSRNERSISGINLNLNCPTVPVHQTHLVSLENVEHEINQYLQLSHAAVLSHPGSIDLSVYYSSHVTAQAWMISFVLDVGHILGLRWPNG